MGIPLSFDIQRAQLREGLDQVGHFREAEAEQVHVARRALRHIEPQVEQQCALEKKMLCMPRNAQAVQQPLQRIAGEHQREVPLFGASLVEQLGAHRGSNIASVHVSASR